jgi:hypothetical protein
LVWLAAGLLLALPIQPDKRSGHHGPLNGRHGYRYLVAQRPVLVAGGAVSNGNTTNSAELYDPAAGGNKSTGAMTVTRRDHTATLLLNGKVLVVGGLNGSQVVTSAELYDPATGTWSTTGAMRDQRALHTTTLLLDGKVLVAGGTENPLTPALIAFPKVIQRRRGSLAGHPPQPM